MAPETTEGKIKKPFRQFIDVNAKRIPVPAVVEGTENTPLPPSVEEAYRRKCIDLKKRTKEVEESNDAARIRKERLNRGIRKMRLERAFLLEMLGKRMKKTGMTQDGRSTFYESESDGSSEGPPTPQERPTRTKKAHRRPVISTPPANDYSGNQQQQQQQQSTSYQSLIYEQPTHQHESPYGPQTNIQPSNGHSASNYSPSQSSALRQPSAVLPSQNAVPSHGQTSYDDGPSNAALEASAFESFFETKYESQAHKYPGIRGDDDLRALAEKHWSSPEYAASRKQYEEQAAKLQALREANPGLSFDAAGRTGLKGGLKSDEVVEGGARGGVASDVEMSDAEGKGASVGFKSVN